MRNNMPVILAVLICGSSLGVSLTSSMANAQYYNSVYTWNGTQYYMFDVTGEPAQPVEAPNGYIAGYVVDEKGNPIPGATVSLLQGSQLWKPEMYDFFPGKSDYYRSDNPQLTRIAYVNDEGFIKEGGFLFGLPPPDEYTLKAEKDGYKGSANIHVGRETQNMSDTFSRAIRANITLAGYRQPIFTPEQLSYTGAIVGEIRTDDGYRTDANVYLWKDGVIIKIPYNPQYMIRRNFSGKHIDYMFTHLAPGNYTVMADSPGGNGSVSVDVGTGIMRADVVVSNYPSPTYRPQFGFTPTVGEFSASGPDVTVFTPTARVSEARPSPASAWLGILSILGAVAYYMQKKK